MKAFNDSKYINGTYNPLGNQEKKKGHSFGNTFFEKLAMFH